MRLADRIIEQGPFTAGDVMPFPTAPNGHPIITAEEINELRDELITGRKGGVGMIIKPTLEMSEALPDLLEILAVIERDYVVHPRCPETLGDGMRCSLYAGHAGQHAPRHPAERHSNLLRESR